MTTAYMPDTVTPLTFLAEPCRIEDCTKPRIVHRTVCSMHDSRIKRHGSPEGGVVTTAYDEVLRSLGLEPSGGGRAPRNGARCGTPSGYVRHRNLGEESCDQCRTANSEYKRKRKYAPKDPAALPPINHGTHTGARQHQYRGEQPCEPCRTAYREWNAARHRKRRARQRKAA